MVAEDEDVLYTEDGDYLFEDEEAPVDYEQAFKQSDDSNIAIFLQKWDKSFENPLFCGNNDAGKVVTDIKNQIEYLKYKSNNI